MIIWSVQVASSLIHVATLVHLVNSILYNRMFYSAQLAAIVYMCIILCTLTIHVQYIEALSPGSLIFNIHIEK